MLQKPPWTNTTILLSVRLKLHLESQRLAANLISEHEEAIQLMSSQPNSLLIAFSSRPFKLKMIM
jgi:hypothetical protein